MLHARHPERAATIARASCGVTMCGVRDDFGGIVQPLRSWDTEELLDSKSVPQGCPALAGQPPGHHARRNAKLAFKLGEPHAARAKRLGEQLSAPGMILTSHSSPMPPIGRPVNWQHLPSAAGKCQDGDVDSFAERLNYVLKLRGMSLGELERAIGRSKGYASRLATGERKHPRPDALAEIAKALRCEMRWLADGTGKKPVKETKTVKADRYNAMPLVRQMAEDSAYDPELWQMMQGDYARWKREQHPHHQTKADEFPHSVRVEKKIDSVQPVSVDRPAKWQYLSGHDDARPLALHRAPATRERRGRELPRVRRRAGTRRVWRHVLAVLPAPSRARLHRGPADGPDAG